MPRRRLALSTAVTLALGLLVGSTVLHLAHSDYGALVTGGLAAALLARRGDFRVNGDPGAGFHGTHGGVFAVMSLEVVDGRVATIRSIVNPDKLGHLGPVESLRDIIDETESRSP